MIVNCHFNNSSISIEKNYSNDNKLAIGAAENGHSINRSKTELVLFTVDTVGRCIVANAALRLREAGYIDDCEPGHYGILSINTVRNYPSTPVLGFVTTVAFSKREWPP